MVSAANAEKVVASKELDAMNTELKRLDEQVAQNTSNPGEWVTRLPILNALYSGNVKVEQNWLPDLTINYNFSQVARFDRCVTCHRGIAKTAPGTASDPMYPTLPEEQLPWLKPYRPQQLVKELAKSLQRELDLASECRNAERIANNMDTMPWIVVPRVHWQHTRERVNVQDFIGGIAGHHLEQLAQDGYDRRLLAQRGAQAVLKMIVEDGLFHA